MKTGLMNTIKTKLVYVAAFLAITFAGLQLQSTAVYAIPCDGGCCTYGVDCLGAGKCCLPGSSEANCSATCANYCRESCD